MPWYVRVVGIKNVAIPNLFRELFCERNLRTSCPESHPRVSYSICCAGEFATTKEMVAVPASLSSVLQLPMWDFVRACIEEGLRQ